jgi:hypothetical protein
MHTKSLSDNMKGSGHLPDLGADGKMILNWDLKETGIGM